MIDRVVAASVCMCVVWLLLHEHKMIYRKDRGPYDLCAVTEEIVRAYVYCSKITIVRPEILYMHQYVLGYTN